jgi:endonuclease/exonuclease/phosphatase family metal-dependent hydrolase
MFERIEIYIRQFRKNFSRSQLLIALLGLRKSEAVTHKRGVIFIQIDALSRKQLEKAIKAGKAPFIKNLLDKQHYKMHSHYSGVPCSTAAVQAELFYGIKSAVPAFSFFDRKSERVFTMFNPKDAREIERRLEKQGEPLLKGGTAYTDIYTGGAEAAHFCIANLGISGLSKIQYPLGFALLVLFHFYSLLRTLVLFVIELCLAVVDFFRGLIKGKDFWKELKFVPSRVGACVLLRELTVIGAKVDIARSVPVIHLNLMGYHEQSHRRGGTSRFAHWTLRGIDDSVKRVWTAAHRSHERMYSVWIYSDHGQVDTVPYEKKFGKSIRAAISQAYNQSKYFFEKGHRIKKIGFLARAGLRRPEFFARIFPRVADGESALPTVAALGPVGHIYLKGDIVQDEINIFIKNLLSVEHIPMVILPNENNKIQVSFGGRNFVIPEQADKVFNNKIPFYDEMVKDFLYAYGRENCGNIMVCGWQGEGKDYYTFAIENGSHGGFSSEEMEGFALLPRQTVLPDSKKKYVRPLDLRKAAFNLLGTEEKNPGSAQYEQKVTRDTLRIMTYNVHGCVGMDGRLSPTRIAQVISQYDPDVVALQELDVGRKRSGGHDQAMLIAKYLNMDHHFHAAMRIEEEAFGDAVLSSYPMRLIKRDSLSRQKKFSFFEPRGAIWVQLDFNNKFIQIINTHLGLKSKERLVHAKELLSEDWLDDPKCKGPMILCGDFNAFPDSRVFRLFHEKLPSVQVKIGRGRHKKTWFGRYPVACLDHIFVSTDFEVVNVEVCDSYLARLASDHRPLIADIKIAKGP